MRNEKYLTEEEVKIFKEFIKDTGMTLQEMVDLQGESKMRQAAFAQIGTGNVTKVFANKIVQEKLKEMKNLSEKDKDLKF